MESIRKSGTLTSATSKPKEPQRYSFFEQVLRKEIRKLNANDELSANVDGVKDEGKRGIT